ncbi:MULTISPECIES: quinolinate synthase NadA [Prochlorococcus]|uniref:Quinolinate synthase n=1 Tax=Prochlorococcus marinus (strain SARG / CCMP1375 / SS120) TaxID=167539 RepID=Q7VBS9_PROMA|nr:MULTISPECIES: quinolinate synthase NadA [Prochlorococcus]AAQ00058.1 Quinolinate synthase [Prochlorococcus marinus subsp. marinus str. CCMP1375]KGG13855.1 Quinolinate synthetase [Prochlorococcus marinus str. LG]KGG18988.1 Quinolinate synthetase [Prochlorococcus marinus str. SS2]KGG23472.1 Quinolinate synthetase [Prochlorococcus marinus str. SS35]KGG32292.1 Quinolinate synthetase [Prochlorococcus marinus str. SS51]
MTEGNWIRTSILPQIAKKKLSTVYSTQQTVLPDPLTRDEVKNQIRLLCKEKNAVILAHYYQDDLIQDIAHFIGDSLELSRKAAETEAEVILFCGVHFMAETAKIICPDKKVIIPDMDAGCSLADECPEEDFKKFINKYPDHYVISYINCSAAVKAQSDLICTSSNAVDLVKRIPLNIPIIFAPDKNLGRWVEKQSGRKMKLWQGSCMVHETFSEESVIKLKLQHPKAEIIAHPECTDQLLDYSDFIGSTSKLLSHVQISPAEEFIVLTEPGIIHQMRIKEPKKKFFEVLGLDGCSCNSCPYMRLNTAEKVIKSLKELTPEIILDEEVQNKALRPIKKMLSLSK